MTTMELTNVIEVSMTKEQNIKQPETSALMKDRKDSRVNEYTENPETSALLEGRRNSRVNEYTEKPETLALEEYKVDDEKYTNNHMHGPLDGNHVGKDRSGQFHQRHLDGECGIGGSSTFDTNSATNRCASRKLPKGPPWYRSQRYILAYVMFGGMMNVFFQRVNLSIAIVCMVNHTATTTTTTTTPPSTRQQPQQHERRPGQHRDVVTESGYWSTRSDHVTYPVDTIPIVTSGWRNDSGMFHSDRQTPGLDTGLLAGNGSGDGTWTRQPTACSALISAGEESEDGPFAWDKKTQGLILGSLFWSYLVTSMPLVSWLKPFPRKYVITVSVTVMCCTAMLLHSAAWWSPWAVLALRLVQGVCMAPAMMSMYGVWTAWAPPDERTGLVSAGFSGSMLANAVVFPLAALLCEHGFLGGWPSVFYVFGIMGLVWVLLLVFLTAETPAQHPWITAEERYYIETSLSNVTLPKIPPTPWRAVLTSPPVWAIVLSQFAFTWGLLLQLATLPQYMKEVLKFNIRSNGVYSMLPYITMLVMTSAAGQITNRLIRRKSLPLVWIRKTICFVGHMVPAILLSILSFLDCTESGIAVFLLTVAVGISGIQFCSFLVNPYDIAPIFAQPIITFSNTLATIAGGLSPYVVAAITKDKTREQWQLVFFLTAAVYVAGTAGFCIMGKAHVQSWAEPRRSSVLIGRTGESEAGGGQDERDNPDDGLIGWEG